MPRNVGLTAILVGSALQLLLMPLAGALSDRFNRRALYAIAAVGGAIWPFLFFPMMLAHSRSRAVLMGGVAIGLVLHAFMYGPQAAFISEQFTPRVRYTGSSLAYSLAGVIGGAMAPLVFTLLLSRFHTWLWIAVYTATACVVTLSGLWRGRDPHLEDEEKLGVG